MFKSIFDLAADVVKIVGAPVEIAVDLTRIVTKPAADVAEEVTEAVKQLAKDATD